MSESLKLAFVGCGAIGPYHLHLDGIREHASRIDVTACIELDETRAGDFAERTRGRPFASVEEALAKGDFDAVDIMLPHDLHEKVGIQCLEAGKHLLLEKPMAPTWEACDRLRPTESYK